MAEHVRIHVYDRAYASRESEEISFDPPRDITIVATTGPLDEDGDLPLMLQIHCKTVQVVYGPAIAETAYVGGCDREDGPYTVLGSKALYALMSERLAKDADGNLHPGFREATPEEIARGEWVLDR